MVFFGRSKRALFILLCVPLMAQAEVGSGVITLASAACPSEQLCFPATPIPLHDGPKGQKLGHLKQTNRFDLTIDLPAKLRQTLKDNLTWTGELAYDSHAIGFLHSQDGFALIAKADGTAFWLDTKALEAAGYKALTWPQFLTHYKGFVTPIPRLNMRSEATTASHRVATINADSELTFTGQFKGLWAEVKVKLYDKNVCYGDAKLLHEHTGWVKYFDASTDALNFDLGGSC